MAETYKPNAKDCDKQYDPEDRPVKENREVKDPVYGTYYLCPTGHCHEAPVLSSDLQGFGAKMNAAMEQLRTLMDKKVR